MLKKTLIALPFILAVAGVQAQAASSPAKKEYVARILKAQQSGIEAMGRALVERPAVQVLGAAGNMLPRVAKDNQETVAKEIQDDVRKYVDEAAPLAQRRALELAPTTVGALLEEKFTEDELRQIAATLESPAFNKFQALGGEMQKVLGEKLVADTRSTIEPKVRAMEESVAKRLGLPAQPAASAPKANGTGAAR